jgi:hypothetical protein
MLIPMSNFTHTTRDGRKMSLHDMTDRHLSNTIAHIERKAKRGVKLQRGGGDAISGTDGYWYDEEVVYGDEALKSLGYQHYIAEKSRRKV